MKKPTPINGHAIAITLTLGDCLQAEGALNRIGALPFPMKTAYHVARLLRFVRAHTATFEETRTAAIKTMGRARDATAEERARGSDSIIFEVPPEKMTDYLQQHRELRAQSVTIDWRPLTLDEFGDQRVAATDLADLGPLLADEEPAHEGGNA